MNDEITVIMNVISILGTVVGILGTGFGVWGVVLAIESKKANRKLKDVTWSDIHAATKYFWKNLKNKKFTPTMIITPGQKGGIVAKMVSDFYTDEIPILTGYFESVGKKPINYEGYTTFHTTKWNIHLPIAIQEYKNKQTAKLLIVDDFVMSGDFLHNLKNELTNLGYLDSNIYACAVAVTKVAIDSKKGPDFYWKVVDDKDFDFPWGKAE